MVSLSALIPVTNDRLAENVPTCCSATASLGVGPGEGEGDACDGVLGEGDCERVEGEGGWGEWLEILDCGLPPLTELPLGWEVRTGAESVRRV